MVRTAAFKSYSKVMAVSFYLFVIASRSAPTGRANARPVTGSAPPDDRFQAIQKRQARLDCFVASAPRNDESSSIDRHAKSERVLYNPQTHFAAQRHQRFRVELHAADRQGLVLDRHRDAVLGARGHIEHIGHAVALDIERMVTADHNLIGQVLHQPPAPHLNSRRPPMRRLAELAELPAEIFADRLHAEADAV